MSRDFRLAWNCPHLTVEEVVTLADDRRSLVTRQPVASTSSVRILVNDEFFIPQSGFSSAAVLASSTSGPFDLIPGEDQFTVQTSQGQQTYDFGLQRLTRYTAEDVVRMFRRDNFTVAYVDSYKGHLTLADPGSVGPDSFVKVSGSAAALLGFGQAGVNGYQRRTQGTKLYPSWVLNTPELDQYSQKYPVFTEPIQGNPLFKVTYSTAPSRCPRCGGSGTENDMRVDASGQSLMVENEDLLNQAALKILLTDRGSNPYHPWYGTDIRARIGSKAISGVATLINEDVRKALVRFQKMQEEQSRFQNVSYKERLYAILGVQVYPHPQIPTMYYLEVTVRNASSEPITLSTIYAAPSVVALLGSNGLVLGNEAAGLTAEQTRAFLQSSGGM